MDTVPQVAAPYVAVLNIVNMDVVRLEVHPTAVKICAYKYIHMQSNLSVKATQSDLQNWPC